MYLEDNGPHVLGGTAACAILADAFSSIMQDRFHTTDFNAKVYTQWGLHRAKTTMLVDLMNQHWGAGIPRQRFITKVPGATHRCVGWGGGGWCCGRVVLHGSSRGVPLCLVQHSEAPCEAAPVCDRVRWMHRGEVL